MMLELKIFELYFKNVITFHSSSLVDSESASS